MNSLPLEIQDIIWEIYWKDIFTKNIIQEFNIMNKYKCDINDILNQNQVFKIDESKKEYYKKLNIIIKICYYNNSFKLLSKTKFFKHQINFDIISKVKEEYKYIAAYMIYHGNYMSYYCLEGFKNLKL